MLFWVPGTGVEPARPRGHRSLKPARLPIPPSGLLQTFSMTIKAAVGGFLCPEQESNLHSVTGTWPSTMRVYHFRHPG